MTCPNRRGSIANKYRTSFGYVESDPPLGEAGRTGISLTGHRQVLRGNAGADAAGVR
jgi:hypothetical protein